MEPYVEVEWLAQRLNDPSIVVVDARSAPQAIFYGSVGREQYIYGHIPGAVHLDYADQLQDPYTPYATRVAPLERFAQELGKVGIKNEMTVVAYDAGDVPYAARVVWMFRYYGHENSAILLGGIDAWLEAGHPREGEIPARRMCRYTPKERPEMRATLEEVLDIAEERSDAQLLATWPDDTYARREREIANARRLSYSALFDPARGVMVSEARVRELTAGLDPQRRTITYCGNGINSAAVYFALRADGFGDVAVYDGSWAEWNYHQLPTVAKDGVKLAAPSS